MNDINEIVFEAKSSQRLADLAGIEQDLELALQACELFLSRPHVGSKEAILTSNCVGTFALVMYFRTLSSGVRSGVTKETIDSLPVELQKSHQKLKNSRDWYVAHSINGQEDNYVHFTFDPIKNEVKEVGTIHTRDATFSASEILEIKHLATKVLEIVRSEYEHESQKVWAVIEKLPRDRILSLPRSRPTVYLTRQQKRKVPAAN